MSSLSTANGREASHASVQMAVQDALLEAEQNLSRLLEETASVREQVHNLRRLQKGLTVLGSTRPEAGVRGQSAEAINRSNEAAEKVTKPASAVEPSHTLGNHELRRACRIALMEAAQPQTVNQIVERIARRESFSFGKELNPEIAVAFELSCLVHEGEACGSIPSGTFHLAPPRD